MIIRIHLTSIRPQIETLVYLIQGFIFEEFDLIPLGTLEDCLKETSE